jgi:nucleoside-diphosphate-sugar epimerase
VGATLYLNFVFFVSFVVKSLLFSDQSRGVSGDRPVRILIIGGTSFMGPVVVRRLVESGHSVTVFHRGQTSARLPTDVQHVLDDRRNLQAHRSEFERLGIDIVIDMIAYIERDALDLLATFRGIARRTVVISSADVYRAYGRFLGLESGPPEETPLREDAPLRSVLFPYRGQATDPTDFAFAYDKIPVEQALMAETALASTVLRLPMVHGPGDTHHRLSAYLKRMDDGRPFIVLEEAFARWKCPRGYVEDVASAIALAATDDRAAGGVFNVAEAKALTEADWVRAIGGAVGWRGKVITAPSGRIAIPYTVEQSLDTDSSRIRRQLGFTEVTTLQRALADTIAWERANGGESPRGIGLSDYAAEDALVEELGAIARPEG